MMVSNVSCDWVSRRQGETCGAKLHIGISHESDNRNPHHPISAFFISAVLRHPAVVLLLLTSADCETAKDK